MREVRDNYLNKVIVAFLTVFTLVGTSLYLKRFFLADYAEYDVQSRMYGLYAFIASSHLANGNPEKPPFGENERFELRKMLIH